MTVHSPLPTCGCVADLSNDLRDNHFSILGASSVAQWSGCRLDELQALSTSWDNMPPDNHLKDGGRYRKRRHSSFVFEHNTLQWVPHRAHWQSVDYNALHGGMARWFEPMLATTVNTRAWAHLLTAFAQTASQVRGTPHQKWCIEAHQFRIDTTDGIGRPTPEGAHRDGVDFVAVFMLARVGIKGGETRVFDAHGPQGLRFTLDEPWSVLLLDDRHMIHESTPIQPLLEHGHRDTLVLTCRAGDFQEAAS